MFPNRRKMCIVVKGLFAPRHCDLILNPNPNPNPNPSKYNGGNKNGS